VHFEGLAPRECNSDIFYCIYLLIPNTNGAKGKDTGPILLRIEDSGAARWTITEIKFSIKFRKVL
jgi:hypothetical protein